MSIPVPLDELPDEIGRWGFGYLATTSDDGRPHLLALRPSVVRSGEGYVLRFATGGGRASRNAAARPRVAVIFPPAPHSDGYSLVIDADAVVDGERIDLTPTSAMLHRPAP